MEVEEIQAQQQQQVSCKFSRVGSSKEDSSKLGHHHFSQPLDDGDDNNGVESFKRPINYSSPVPGESGADSINSLRGWHHSSRIIRVSRASGGKDRHSKVWTSKGLRDRRVRLSVTTAIQFYDLQDRLGFDQPSKAVEWLIKAAADSIAELPSLNGHFPPVDQKSSKDPLGSPEADDEEDGQSLSQPQLHGSLSKSACSSTSDTSKGSGLSLSRGDARVKARERARERTAKEKEKERECEPDYVQPPQDHQTNSTFTELLTAGFVGSGIQLDPGGGGSPAGTNIFNKTRQVWPLTSMDYMSGGSMNGAHCIGRSSQIHLGNPSPQGMAVPMLVAQSGMPFGAVGESNGGGAHHLQQYENLQHFGFGSDQFIVPVAAAAAATGVDYNLNFTISSSPRNSAAGYNRGTLQSNSMSSTASQHHSLLSHLHRLSATTNVNNASIGSSPMNGSTSYLPFLIGAAGPATMDSHHQQFPQHGLQLLYGDESRHSEHKGKGKS